MRKKKILTPKKTRRFLSFLLFSIKKTDKMSTKDDAIPTISFSPVTDFNSLGDCNSGALQWYCPPDEWKPTTSEDDDITLEASNKEGWWRVEEKKALLLAPPARKDFWRKTYYEPLLVKDDGPFVYATIHKTQLPVMIETSFTIQHKSQFDQAGILIRLDSDHWIKTGIEVVDNKPRLSCVVTNSFSDWSTQDWPEPQLKIRVHILPQHGGSFVVEAAPYTDDSEKESKWTFVRIAHMNQDMKHTLLDDHPTVEEAYKERMLLQIA